MPRHHLVPKMLLKRFADADEKIVMVPRLAPTRGKVTKVTTACAEVGFYVIPTDDVAESHRVGHDPEGVEATLAQIESDTAPLVDRLIDGILPDSPQQRFRMSMFMALQFTRGWRFREDINDMATAVARQYLAVSLTPERLAIALREQGEPVNDDSIAAFRAKVLEGGWRLQLSQPHAVQEALRFAMESCLPELLQRRWRLLRFNVPLLISDAPVTLWSPTPPNDCGSPPGIATARMIVLPLDRRTALALVHADNDKIVAAGPNRARQINAAVAANAHRWIFHHPDDDPLQDLRLGAPAAVRDEVRRVGVHPDGSVGVVHWLVKRPEQDSPLD